MAIDDNNWNIILQSSKTTDIPSGKRLHNNGKSPFPMGKSTISMAIFNSYASLPGYLEVAGGCSFSEDQTHPNENCSFFEVQIIPSKHKQSIQSLKSSTK